MPSQHKLSVDAISPEKPTLRELRQAKGLSIERLATIADISSSVIWSIECDKKRKFNIHQDVATALAHALGVTPEDISWPKKLSHIGRPPHTGTPYSRSTTSTTVSFTPYGMTMTMRHEEVTSIGYDLCPHCNLALPVTGICDCTE